MFAYCLILVALALGAAPDRLATPIPWPQQPTTTRDILDSIAQTMDLPYVIMPSARPLADKRSPFLAGKQLSLASTLRLIRASSRLTPWISEQEIVWFEAGSCPNLLSLAAAVQPPAACPKHPIPPAKATFELSRASAKQTAITLAQAFDLPVVWLRQNEPTDRRVNIDAEDIELSTALAIICEALEARATFDSEVLVLHSVDAPTYSPYRDDENSANLVPNRLLTDRPLAGHLFAAPPSAALEAGFRKVTVDSAVADSDILEVVRLCRIGSSQ